MRRQEIPLVWQPNMLQVRSAMDSSAFHHENTVMDVVHVVPKLCRSKQVIKRTMGQVELLRESQ